VRLLTMHLCGFSRNGIKKQHGGLPKCVARLLFSKQELEL
jgi:hypothetical protein